ncbi:MAG: DUF1214 domain-containing protein [Gammaproteobacteria bacterium]|nr:DUF1214 domain-containing protein [Gammaproteobacteria bacterium]
MESRQALDEFLDVIRNADQTFLDPDKELDHQGKVDGYQHMFHLLQVAVDFYLHNDPLRPRLMPLADASRKLYGDNVDAVYYFSQVRGDQQYLISGQRFDSCYLSFCLYGGDPNGELADRVTLNVNHRDITFADDGTFELLLTPNPDGPNEFSIDADSVSLFTREYFFDRPASRESILSIRNVSPQPPALPLDDAQLARRIRNMAMFFQCTTWLAPLPVEFPVNEFCPPFEFDAEQGGWGTVDNIYCFCRFRLKEHQYLKISFASTEACYWGFQTWNYLMQSTNYVDFPVCINKATAAREPNGDYVIYLSHRPAPKNWISTAGYEEGILFARWLLAESLPETPRVEVGEWSSP